MNNVRITKLFLFIVTAIIINLFPLISQGFIDITGRFIGSFNYEIMEIPFAIGDDFKEKVNGFELNEKYSKVIGKDEVIICTYKRFDQSSYLVVFKKKDEVFRIIGGYTVIDFGGNGATISIRKIKNRNNQLFIDIEVIGYLRSWYNNEGEYEVEPSEDKSCSTLVIEITNWI